MTMQDDFDFTKPHPVLHQDNAPPLAPFKAAVSKFYDADVASRFFQVSGKREAFPAGQTLFVENEKSGKQGMFGKRVSHRMYLITEGEVALSVASKPLDTIKPGEIFGEMALVDQSPRTASAVAETESALLAINRAALIALVKAEPAVGLTMLRSVSLRLRHMNALLT